MNRKPLTTEDLEAMIANLYPSFGSAQEQRPNHSQQTKSHECVFEYQDDGYKTCNQCGVMKEYRFEEQRADLYNPKLMQQIIHEHCQALGILQRDSLQSIVEKLIQSNQYKVQRSQQVIPHILKAVEQVSQMREFIKIRGNTPIKMVSVIARQALAGTFIDVCDVDTLLGLDGANLTSAHGILQTTNSMYQRSRHVDEQSQIANFLKGVGLQLTPAQEQIATELYDRIDATRKWIGNTEQTRMRIASLAFLIKDNAFTNNKKDIQKLIDLFEPAAPELGNATLVKAVKKYIKDHDLFSM